MITFDDIKKTDRIGIMLSGGMDSALLLYLLANNINNNILTFTVPKTDGAEHYVGPIVAWINAKLNKHICEPKLIGNPSLHHTQIINYAIQQIDSECDILYFAGNSYPNDVLPNGPKRVRRTNPKHKQPFFDWYKTDILQAYVDNDIMDLIPLTHTCTEQKIGRCNTCWQCRERQWAFQQLCIVDTSTT